MALINQIKRRLVRFSASMCLPLMFSPSPRIALTSLLYHRILAPGETMESGRSRLRRQCEWLRSRYIPLSIDDALQHLASGTLPEYPLLCTVDDAKVELLQLHSVFSEFGIPVTVFPCVGWTCSREPLDPDLALCQLVDLVYWYEGPSLRVDVGTHQEIDLCRQNRNKSIDSLLQGAIEGGADFVIRAWERILEHSKSRHPSATCNWSELSDLRSWGATIGSHTVTHCRLADASDIRLKFELEESKRLIAQRIDSCNVFAYPYGTFDVVSNRTSLAIQRARYRCAFLTHAGFATSSSDIFRLPRLVVPDESIHDSDYRALVCGGQIPFQVVQRRVLNANRKARVSSPAQLMDSSLSAESILNN